ncbi:MAG: ABC transporter permease subunit, partial [Acidimicrobiales bacterium]
MNEVTLVGLMVDVVAFGLMLYLAALGEVIAEKAGVLNLGVEGMMAVGGVAAFWSGTEFGNPVLGLVRP